MFHVGQKVVCVKTGGTDWNPSVWRLPVKHRVYTIREVFSFGAQDFVRLTEIVNALGGHPQCTGLFEPRFLSSRFRPLVDLKTDIGVLTALLDPANHKELADG